MKHLVYQKVLVNTKQGEINNKISSNQRMDKGHQNWINDNNPRYY